MSSAKTYARVSMFFLPVVCGVLLASLEGCQNPGERTTASSDGTSSVLLGAAATPQQAGQAEAKTAPAPSSKGFAQMWAENCIRCHNSRDPRTYTDAEWTIAMHHMRVRANLTAEEHRSILEYLKASN